MSVVVEGTSSEQTLGTSDAILVVGGGIAGITAALEAAEAGSTVFLVEKNAYLGGRVAQLARYFPKLCPPNCGLEINFQRLRDNRQIRFFTSTEVEEIRGEPGRYEVSLRREPRYVNDRCISCNRCAEVCPVERPNAFDYGMSTTKTAYLPYEMAYPMKYAIDGTTCLFDECHKCVDVCPVDAIDLHEEPETLRLTVGAVVMATGWKPYDAHAIGTLAFGHYRNVVTNVMIERMAAENGPTDGRILRPSDSEPVKSVAFIQCAGSRDRLHLGYCSSICCLASLKEASMVLERHPEAEVHIFYIDLRTPGTYEAFAEKILSHPNVRAVKGKVADIVEDPDSHELTVIADAMVDGAMSHTKVDLVVLATGMQPSVAGAAPTGPLSYDPDGFVVEEADGSGIFAAGCARAPVDVATATMDATAAAMLAMQTVNRAGRSG
ncbi:MAG: FAD-dependent oxidoreductase [Solirubrobacteraceae bacterium]